MADKDNTPMLVWRCNACDCITFLILENHIKCAHCGLEQAGGEDQTWLYDQPQPKAENVKPDNERAKQVVDFVAVQQNKAKMSTLKELADSEWCGIVAISTDGAIKTYRDNSQFLTDEQEEWAGRQFVSALNLFFSK